MFMLCVIFRSEIAWRDAKYAQILEYLREEYEVAQRFGDLDFKLKFVEVMHISTQMLYSQFWTIYIDILPPS